MDLIWHGNRLLVPGGSLHLSTQPGAPPAPPTEVTIGTQVWKTTNVSDNISGSKVYNDNEANRSIYGGLYLISHIAAIEALYPGWHVATWDEYKTLAQFTGGAPYYNGASYIYSVGELKETGFTHWNSPNFGATDAFGWTGLPGGYATSTIYTQLGLKGSWWTSTTPGFGEYYAVMMSNQEGTDFVGKSEWDSSVQGPGNIYRSIRLIKNA